MDNYTVTVEETGNITVQVSTVATVEVANNPVNLGTGAEVFAGVVGDALTFKTISSTDTNITITETATDITLDMPETLNVNINGNTTGTHFGNVVGGDISVNNITTTGVTTSGNIIPSADNTYDLGSDDYKWRSLFLSGGSLYIDGHKVIGSDETGQIDITTDPDQNLNIQAGGDIIMASDYGNTFFNDSNVFFGPATGGGTTNVRGTLDVTGHIEVGTTDIYDGIIDFTGENQNGTIRTNGAAYLFAETGNMYVGSFSDYTQITGSTVTASIFNGTLQGEVSTLENHTTDNLNEGNANLYYTDARVDARIPTVVSAFTNDSGYITSASLNGYATEQYVDAGIQDLINLAPGALDTLGEIADAIGDDPNFSTTITNQIASKLNTTDFTTTADTWLGTKSTTNLAEGTNLYYTDTRFDNRLALKSTSDIAEGVNLYYTDGRVNAVFDTKTTDDLDEGATNLYYTEARVDANFAAKTTDDLTEGTNEYYTDTKVRNAISLTTTNNSELSYDPLTGVFSYVSPTTVTAANAVEIYVRNQTGATLAKGDAVYISGHSGTDVLVERAQNDVAGEYPAIGLVSGAINNNSNGYVTVQGELAGVDTTAFNVGDVLYLSELPGQITNVRPADSTKAVQNIGKVARSHSSGIIIISGSGRANDVPNLDHLEVFIGDTVGYQKRQLELSDLSDVNNFNPQAGDVLTWDAVNLQYIPQSVSGSGGGAGYTEGIVDSHLNISTATSGQLLSWNGTDYDWVNDRVELTDLSVTQNSAGVAGLSYDNTTGVFTYTPPDVSDYIALTDISITSNPAGSPALSYDNTTGVFTYTPADISDFITLADISVSTQANSGSGALSYDINTGIFTYTPPDLTGYLTIETDTLQSVTNRGAATTNTCIVPFYYQDQAAFPNATTYHGAMAHSHTDGAMYFAHAAGWVELSNKADVDTALGDIDTALTTILGS